MYFGIRSLVIVIAGAILAAACSSEPTSQVDQASSEADSADQGWESGSSTPQTGIQVTAAKVDVDTRTGTTVSPRLRKVATHDADVTPAVPRGVSDANERGGSEAVSLSK